jgi:hypothetical protein
MHGLILAGGGSATLLLLAGGWLIRRYRKMPRGRRSLNAPPPEQEPRGRHRAE